MPTCIAPVTDSSRATVGTGENELANAAGTAWLSPNSSVSRPAARAAAAISSTLRACCAVSNAPIGRSMKPPGGSASSARLNSP